MYRHTQFGWVIVCCLVVALLVLGVLTLSLPHRATWVDWIASPILVTCLLLFYNLTVTVTRDSVHLRFGIGIIQKRFPLGNISSVEVVRNCWAYGWGIHYGPGGWLYNVSGFDAVELRMRNGSRCRIGTDEPERLKREIEDQVARSPRC